MNFMNLVEYWKNGIFLQAEGQTKAVVEFQESPSLELNIRLEKKTKRRMKIKIKWK